MFTVTIEDLARGETTMLEFDEMSVQWDRAAVPMQTHGGEVRYTPSPVTDYTIHGTVRRRLVTPFPDGPLGRLRMAFAGKGYGADEMRVAMDEFLESQVALDTKERAG